MKIKSILYILIGLSLTACSLTKYPDFNIDENTVIQVTIRERNQNTPIELSKEQISELLEGLNSNQKIGPTKFIKKYWIELQLQNGSIVTLGCNNSIFYTENDIQCYETKSPNFIENFWRKLEEN